MSLNEAVDELVRIANAHLSESQALEKMQSVFARYIVSQSRSTESEARAALTRAFIKRGVEAVLP
jgi:hypothetical protein